VDSQGDLWITQHGPSFISEFNPAKNYFRTISTSVPSWVVDRTTLPYFIRVDTKGNVWFNEHYGNAIGVFDPSDETLVEYEIPSRLANSGNLSFALTLGLAQSGDAWFTELLTGKIGVISPNVSGELSLSFENESQIVVNQSKSVNLQVSNNSSDTAFLGAYVGNSTQNLQFNFSQSSGKGNFDSTLTIKSASAAPGVYFVTLSAETRSVIYSRVIEVIVTNTNP
jgi:virginiamycin B lyase